MKHASGEALDQIETLLLAIRTIPGIKERQRGVFYRKSKAFIHFHEDKAEIYADARLQGDDFTRYCVTSPAQQTTFVEAVKLALS